MREQDLIDLGFRQYEVTAEESGANSFYYYAYRFSDEPYDLSLITPSNTEVIDDEWYAYIFECDPVKFRDRSDLKTLLDLIRRNIPICN